MGKPCRPMSLRELLRGQVWSHCGGTNWTLPGRLSTFHVDLHTNEPLSKCYPSYIFTGKCLIFTWIYLSKIHFVYVLSENVSVYVGKGNVCVLCMSVCVCQWGASLVSWGNPGTLACVSHLRPSTQEESTLTFLFSAYYITKGHLTLITNSIRGYALHCRYAENRLAECTLMVSGSFLASLAMHLVYQQIKDLKHTWIMNYTEDC